MDDETGIGGRDGVRLRDLRVNDVIQFTETHKWCGAFAIVDEVRKYEDGTAKIMAGVPMLRNDGVDGTAYIFVTKDEDVERIGRSVMIPTPANWLQDKEIGEGEQEQ